MAITMYDTITLANMPAGAAAYAGYVGGNWPTFSTLKSRFPNAHLLDIAVNASENATCLDVEAGDATNAQAPAWFNRQKARGVAKPVLYTSGSNATALISTMSGAGIARSQYRLWSAHYTGRAHLCTSACKLGNFSADATQYTDNALGKSLDASYVSDSFFSGAATVPGIPTNGTTTVTSTSATIHFTGVATAVKYRVQVYAGDSLTGKLVHDAYDNDGTAGKDGVVVSGLAPATKYGWRVVATNSAGASGSWSGLIGFTTAQAALPLPTGFKYTPSADRIRVDWTAAPGATTYSCQLMDATEKTQIARQSVTGGSVTFTGLNPSTKYEFRILSEASGKVSSPWSGYVAVTTLADPNAYSAPTGLAMSGWINVSFSWKPVSLNDKDAASYTVAVYDVNGNLFGQQTVTTTTATVPVAKGTYQVHVWANGSLVAPQHASLDFTV